jgi:hypothetical protein
MKRNEERTSILIVNHYGLLTKNQLAEIKENYINVIIDNCSAFFTPVIPECFNVYSCRKFFGVPDGAYVIGDGASSGTESYSQDESSETSSFLLKRIEKGCNTVYDERSKNEERINRSGILKMSVLTRSLLNSINYTRIRDKRIENFRYAHSLYGPHNSADSTFVVDGDGDRARIRGSQTGDLLERRLCAIVVNVQSIQQASRSSSGAHRVEFAAQGVNRALHPSLTIGDQVTNHASPLSSGPLLTRVPTRSP